MCDISTAKIKCISKKDKVKEKNKEGEKVNHAFSKKPPNISTLEATKDDDDATH